MFIQHVFPPLGFIPDKVYNDSMSLLNSQSFGTTSLSPAYGNSVISFITSRVRFWSPLYSTNADLDISIPLLKSTHLYAKSILMERFYVVLVLNF